MIDEQQIPMEVYSPDDWQVICKAQADAAECLAKCAEFDEPYWRGYCEALQELAVTFGG